MSSNSESHPGASTRPSVETQRRGVPKRAVVWGLIALATFDVLFWLLAVQPLANRSQEHQVAVAALENLVRQKTDRVELLRRVRDKVGGASEGGDALLDELTFDRRSTFSQLLTRLGDAADQAGVEIRETDYVTDEIDGNAQFGIVSITANFRGRYENLVRFVNLLDRSEAFLIVERLAARPRQDTGDLQISMRIDTFVKEALPEAVSAL